MWCDSSLLSRYRVKYLYLKIFKYFFSSICVCIWDFHNEHYLFLNTLTKYSIFKYILKYIKVLLKSCQAIIAQLVRA